ncbi:coiled-coil domain-containing protein 159 isoform X2 [Varanus komodoensis]|uniref:coiled-coil domain-containing protein 159 isoform X2 n=1 Tax=Varanus komodoensis TaxID=61221 RepID=UPI001CF77A56|nr:coiled-coil domain-containing protein 159 isoform X2 [Varanus komodoensis]
MMSVSLLIQATAAFLLYPWSCEAKLLYQAMASQPIECHKAGHSTGQNGPAMMTIAQEEKNRDTSPSWYQARAGSMISAGQLEMKPHVMIPESQVVLKNDLELIKAQLHAQTNAVQLASHSVPGEMLDGLMESRIQEVWKLMSKEVEGLQDSMIQKESSMKNLTQEVLESKKFLWEELEAVQGELQHIHQKLKDQEVDITRNLVSIKKMQENQMKCSKFLTQMRDRIPNDASHVADNKPMSEELNDIWSAINTLRNSISSCSIWSDRRGSSRIKGRANQQHRKPASPGTIFSDSALYQHHSSPEHSS